MRAYRRWFHHNIRVRVDLPLQKFSWGQDKRIDRRSRMNFEVDGSLSHQLDHAYSRSVAHWLTDATAIYRRGTGTTLWHLIDATATYIISLWHLWESIKWNHVPATKPTAGTLSTVVWGIALFVACQLWLIVHQLNVHQRKMVYVGCYAAKLALPVEKN